MRYFNQSVHPISSITPLFMSDGHRHSWHPVAENTSLCRVQGFGGSGFIHTCSGCQCSSIGRSATQFFFFKVPRRPLGRGDRQGPWECHTIILVPARWAELTAEPARSGGDASSGHGPGDEGRAAVAWRVCSSWNKTLFYHLQSPLLASPPARHLGAGRLSGRLSRCSSSPTRDGHMSPSLAGSERARVLVPTALIATESRG